jgi:hypothetical protein
MAQALLIGHNAITLRPAVELVQGSVGVLGRTAGQDCGETRSGPSWAGTEAKEQQAQRWVREMLAQAGWEEGAWDQRRKGDPAKTRMAARRRRESTMTWEWMAKR